MIPLRTWAALAALVVLAWVHRPKDLRSAALLIVLAVAAFPYETVFGPSLDGFLQYLTAYCAAPLVTITGLEVEVIHGADPIISGHNLTVTVTALCAGAHTLLTLLVLGLVVAEVFLDRPKAKLMLVVLTPVFGFSANVVRVVASTHAARHFGSGGNWAIAHDVIGYAAFVAVYGVLFLIVKRLRAEAAMTGNMIHATTQMATQRIHEP